MKNKKNLRKINVVGLVTAIVLSGTILFAEAKDISHLSMNGGDLRNLTGNYFIQSIPGNASIYLDSVYQGVTPLYIPDVPVGLHTVELKKFGYVDWTARHYLHEGQTIVYNATLVPVLTLIAPDYVWENNVFQVTVLSGGLSVPNATVYWNISQMSFSTDENGHAWVRAPKNVSYGFDMLIAEKTGCAPDYKLIVILPTIIGDVNGDGNVSFADINPFVYALSNGEIPFVIHLPTENFWAADVNQDGLVDFGDINPFIALLTGG